MEKDIYDEDLAQLDGTDKVLNKALDDAAKKAPKEKAAKGEKAKKEKVEASRAK